MSLREYVNRGRIVSSFLSYVQIDSPTKFEKEFCDFLAQELESLGMTTQIDSAGSAVGSNTGNLIARLPGTTPGRGRAILFSCHMDTVSPGIGIKPVIRDDTIFSDGTTILGADDKSGIAAVIEAIRIVRERGLEHGDIEIVFSIYEEGGLHGAKNLDYSLFGARCAFVLDSGGDPGKIVIRGPAQDKLFFRVIGTPAHAGTAPQNGVSAIQAAASAIARMRLLRVDEETTANIGRIEGGTVTNVVAAEAIVMAEARSLDEAKLDRQSEHMIACFENAAAEFGAQVEVRRERMYPGYQVPQDAEIVENVRAAARAAGLEPYTASTGGGSDANIYSANGLDSVNLGTGQRAVHTLGEHIRIDDLVSSAALVLELIRLYGEMEPW